MSIPQDTPDWLPAALAGDGALVYGDTKALGTNTATAWPSWYVGQAGFLDLIVSQDTADYCEWNVVWGKTDAPTLDDGVYEAWYKGSTLKTIVRMPVRAPYVQVTGRDLVSGTTNGTVTALAVPLGGWGNLQSGHTFFIDDADNVSAGGNVTVTPDYCMPGPALISSRGWASSIVQLKVITDAGFAPFWTANLQASTGVQLPVNLPLSDWQAYVRNGGSTTASYGLSLVRG